LNRKHIISFFFFLGCWFQQINAQIKPSFHFTEDDGLPGNTVKDIVKDKNGILWIATDNGIARYDGENFENLNKTDGLPSNQVWSLVIDKDNVVYAGCFNSGLAVIRNDSVIKVYHTTGKQPNTFRKLFYSEYYSKVFVGTDMGIYVMHNNKLVPLACTNDTNAQSKILSISGKDSKLYFTNLHGQAQGLYQLCYNNRYPEKSYSRRISPFVRFSSAIVNHNVFSGDYNHFIGFNISRPWQQPMQFYTDSLFFIWCMKPYKREMLWIGGLGEGRFRGDILIFDTKTKKIIPGGLRQNIQTVNAIFYDPSADVTWFGRDNGLTAYRESPFEYVDFNGKENILDIGFAGDSLLILTENGVYLQNKGQMIPVLAKRQITARILQEWNKNNRKYGVKFKALFDASRGAEPAYFTMDNNRLFIRTAMGAISAPDLKTYLPFGVGPFKVLEDGAALYAINYVPLKHLKSIKTSLDYVYPEGERVLNAFKIIESNGAFYFPTYFDGLYVVKNNRVFKLNDLNSAIENNLTDIEKDSDGQVWCSTENGKLYEIGFNTKPYLIRRLDLSAQGLTGNKINWIKFNGNYLYIGTNKGLNIITKKSLNSGKPTVEYFYNAYNGYDFASAVSPVVGSDGKLYVHTLNEVISIDTNMVKNIPLKLDVYKVLINDEKADLKLFNGENLSYSVKQISFAFRAIKYPLSNNVKYRYRINNDAWTSGKQVNLYALRAGKYDITLEAYDKETLQKISKHITFSIAKPFWQTLWFLLIVITALFIASFQLILARYKVYKKRNEEKTKLLVSNSELQLRSLQIQMNPHFIFNALTSMQHFILTKNVEESLIYLGSLASIIRTNLENATKDYIPLDEEIEFLNKYIQIERIRFKEKLQIELINKSNYTNLFIPPMLIQPLIENAIKHGIQNIENRGIVQVQFNNDENALMVSIQDNGIGREAAQIMNTGNNKKMGVGIIRSRLALLNELNHTDIHNLKYMDLYTGEIPSGTRVIMTLMLKQQ